MLDEFVSAVKTRAIAVFVMIHVGLVISIVAIGRASATEGWDQTTLLFAIGAGLLYVGFIMGVAFIVLPLLPWLKRAKQVEHWTDRIARDLPMLLEHLPKVIAAIQQIIETYRATYKDARHVPGARAQAERAADSERS